MKAYIWFFPLTPCCCSEHFLHHVLITWAWCLTLPTLSTPFRSILNKSSRPIYLVITTYHSPRKDFSQEKKRTTSHPISPIPTHKSQRPNPTPPTRKWNHTIFDPARSTRPPAPAPSPLRRPRKAQRGRRVETTPHPSITPSARVDRRHRLARMIIQTIRDRCI